MIVIVHNIKKKRFSFPSIGQREIGTTNRIINNHPFILVYEHIIIKENKDKNDRFIKFRYNI